MKRVVIVSGLFGATLLTTYWNHFHNSFHFDDFHTITQNPAIRSLANVPRFFTDSRTFSVLPANRTYRPIVSASLALDYRFGGGLDPLWFHISTFSWYAVQLALMYLLFVRIMDLSRPGPGNSAIALMATAWYGLHPANAETINYVIQRGDLYSTLGVVAGLVLYSYWRDGRKWGVYLLPVALGALAKPAALVFAPLLFVYIVLFESETWLNRNGRAEPVGPENSKAASSVPPPPSQPNLRRAARASVPALAACVALGLLEVAMTPRTFVSGASSRVQYWLTQPIVAVHYFKTFFLPTELSADTDRQLVTSIFSEGSIIGLAFLGALLFAAWRTLRIRETRPIAFGLLWFLIALLPTSLFPLAEVENDHRMFFPFAGLALAVCCAGASFIERRARHSGMPAPLAGAGHNQMLRSSRLRAVLTGCTLCLLAAYAYGTHLRNEVWRSEESLWRDVTEKSPRNGRGLMNYGLTQLAKGNTMVAYNQFQQAAVLTPNYSTLEINLGVAAGLLRRDIEAEQHFRRAIALAPDDSRSYFFYGRWLQARGRVLEAITTLNRSAAMNPADLDPQYALMLVYSQRSDWAELQRVADEVLRVAPGDAEALRYSEMAQNAKGRLSAAERLAGMRPTPENYLILSLLYNQSGRFEDSIRAAQEALRLRPDYAEAYNNIAAGHESLARWSEAIAAAREAIRLKPDFELARNNLAYALSQEEIRARSK
jgi:tetratricopeptide (TPR) repeat protein